MQNLDEANRMLDVFASVGAHSFAVTKTELEWPDHKKVKWGLTYTAAELRRKLPAMIRTAAIRRAMTLDDGRIVSAGENLIIRPIGDTAFVQLDDLSAEQLEQLKPAAFLMHTTSPGNHQAWIAVSGIPTSGEPFKIHMRRVRDAVGANDKSASGATRISGSENWKLKNLPEPPTVMIIHAVPGRIVTPEHLESLGLLAAADLPSERVASPSVPSGERRWPDYQRCLAGAPLNADGTGPDRSKADYTFCKFAAQRGFTVEEIAAELPLVSEKARERIRLRDPGYVTVTAENGAVAGARSRQDRGRG